MYFTRLYEAALAKDIPQIKALLDEGACIDEREVVRETTTVAGKLAAAGKIEEAMLLVNRFGAEVSFVYFGLLKAGFTVEANKLSELFQVVVTGQKNLTDLTYIDSYFHMMDFFHPMQYPARTVPGNYFLSVIGDIPAAREQNQRYNLNLSGEALAYGGHLYFMEKNYLIDHIDIEFITIWTMCGDTHYPHLGISAARFLNEKLALHSLSFIQDNDFLNMLMSRIEQYARHRQFDIELLKSKSRLINRIMNESPLDYQQTLVLVESPGLTALPTDILIQKAQQVAEIMNLAQLSPQQAASCVAKTTADEIKKEIKIYALVNCYGINYQQAQQYLDTPGLRTWLHLTRDKSNKDYSLPMEIIEKIESKLLGGSSAENDNFFAKTTLDKTDTLPKLQFSQQFFQSNANKQPAEITQTTDQRHGL